MTQPKYKFGTKLRDKKTKAIFFAEMICWRTDKKMFFYIGNDENEQLEGWSPEIDVEEVKEPMRVEFECEWLKFCETNFIDSRFFHIRPLVDREIIEPFVGKKTKVVITEVVE